MKLTFCHIIPITFLLVLFSACEKDFISEDDSQLQLIIHSNFSPNETWQVNVSTTKRIGVGGESCYVDNAIVQIKDFVTQQSFILEYSGEDGIYHLNSQSPQAGHSYEVQVITPDYETAYAVSSVPSLEDITINNLSIDYQLEELSSREDESLEIKVDFTNNDNVYFYKIVEYSVSNIDVAINETLNTVDFNDLIDIKFAGSAGDKGFLSNPQANSTTSNVATFGNPKLSYGIEEQEDKEFALHIIVASKELLDYHESKEQTPQTINNISSLTSTNSIYTNVNNGFGIFGAYNQAIIKL